MPYEASGVLEPDGDLGADVTLHARTVDLGAVSLASSRIAAPAMTGSPRPPRALAPRRREEPLPPVAAPPRRSDQKVEPVLPKMRRASEAACRALLEAGQRRALTHNECLYLQDDTALGLYILVAGHVRLSCLMEDGSAVICRILAAGDCFGELAVFDQGTQCDMATSLGDSVVVLVPHRAFAELGRRHPELDRALAQLVADRYRDYVELTRILSLPSLSARLSQSILRLADSLGTVSTFQGRKVPAIGPIVTQSDLGLMSRGARGNVNRTLKDWEQKGLIAIRDREILVLDRQKLNAVSYSDDD